MQASFYYTYGYFKYLKYILQRQRRWPYPNDTLSHKIFNIIIIAIGREPFVSVGFFALLVIGITLFVFLLMQVSQVSRNVTQIEVAKIADLKEDGIILKKSPYSKGFIQNWKECLFPEKLEPCEPFEIEYNENGAVCIPGFMIDDDEELIKIRKQIKELEEEQERIQKEWLEKKKD